MNSLQVATKFEVEGLVSVGVLAPARTARAGSNPQQRVAGRPPRPRLSHGWVTFRGTRQLVPQAGYGQQLAGRTTVGGASKWPAIRAENPDTNDAVIGHFPSPNDATGRSLMRAGSGWSTLRQCTPRECRHGPQVPDFSETIRYLVASTCTCRHRWACSHIYECIPP